MNSRKLGGLCTLNAILAQFLLSPVACEDLDRVVHGRLVTLSPPQYPRLLERYSKRPSWEVAGVDYAVGPQAGVTLKDPSGIKMAGVSLDATHHWVIVTGNNVRLNGYDFTQSGGWTLIIEGQNDTISNFKIRPVSGSASPPIQTPSGSGANNTTIERCSIDGGGGESSNVNGGQGIGHYAGSLTLEYCWIKNFTEAGATLGSTTTSLIEYNLFDSAKFDDNFHSQFINAPRGASNTIVKFNTFYQPAAVSNGFPGFMVAAFNDAGYNDGPDIAEVVFANNTGVALGRKGHRARSPHDSYPAMENWVNFTNSQRGTARTIRPIATGNYVTMSAVWHDFAYPFFSTTISPSLADNWNMENGDRLPDYRHENKRGSRPQP